MARGAVSGISLVPKLGISRNGAIFKITCTQVAHKLKIAKDFFILWTNWLPVMLRNYSQFGNNSAIILVLHKVASSVNLYRFTYLRRFPQRRNFRKLLVGEASPIPFERHLRCQLRIHSEYFYLLTSAQFA